MKISKAGIYIPKFFLISIARNIQKRIYRTFGIKEHRAED